ncbi:hypothetical protein [Enterobacter asburiae]|uniref:hypothetical protein n=1 Tax=Enterobacter asburiae TaxID=61645 RepID=UPI000BB92717|nr:hypothetical protein [Enterobacter asburiae]
MDIEAYKVAVRLSLTENVTAGLIGLSRHFATAENSAANLRSQLALIGKMTAVGGGLLAVGGVLTKGLDSALKSAREVAKAQADFKTLNLTTAENASVYNTAANLTHKTLGSSIAGNIKLIQDLHTAFGDLHHALDTAPAFTKYETAVKMALGEKSADGMVNAAAKALEHRGGKVVNDPKEFEKELNMMSQVQFATKNRVSPRDFLLASQTGKMAYALMDPEYLYGKFAGLMSMSSGDRVGTAAMTYFSSIISGRMDKKAKGFLADLGLYEEGVSKARLDLMKKAMNGMSPEDRKLYLQSVGGESILSGGLKSQYVKMAVERPDQFADLLAERIRQVHGKDLTDDQVLDVAKHFNRNTGDYLGQLLKNKTKLEKDTNVFRHSMQFDSAYNNYLNSPDGASTALSTSWTNLKAVIGLQLLPTVNKLTLGLAKLFDKMSEFAEKNPTLTKMATYAIAAAAGLTTLAGAVVLLSATILAARLVSSVGIMSTLVGVLGGPLVWAAVAAAGAGLLIYKNWDKVKPEAKKMGEEFSGIMSVIGARLKQVGNHVFNNFVSAFESFASKLQKGWNGIYDYIVSLLNKIPGANFLTSSEQGVKGNALQLMQDIHSITSGGGKSPVSGIFTESTKVPGGQSFAEGMRQTAAGMSAPPVVSKNDQMIQVYSNLHMDGKKIAEGVTTHQVKQASRAPTGPSGVDSSMNLIHAGMGSLVPR